MHASRPRGREASVVPETFRAMPRWGWDAPGRAWLDELPGLIDRRCAAWGLQVDGPAMHGSNALVVPVRRGAERFALRLAPPGDDVGEQAAALRLWDGRGAVRLIDADQPARAMLLERLDDRRTLAGLPVLDAVRVLGGLTRVLAVPVPADVPSTADVARDALRTFPLDWEAHGRPVPRPLLDAVLQAAGRRAEAPVPPTAVDGDLHHDQVLGTERLPWVVVDPVLLRGDPEYDLARALWARLDELPGDADVRGAFHAFVEAAAVPQDRARDWVLVRAASYLLWGLRHGLTIDPPRCVRLLRLFA